MPDAPAPRRRFRKRWLLATVALLALVAAAGPRTDVDPPDARAVMAEPPADLRALAAWVRERERRAGVADTLVAATITFAGDTARTPWAVVYLHGFSATRQESAPVSAEVARALGANLYEARLTGHGLPGDSMKTATAGDWMADAERAVAIGRRLGDSVVVIGLSTGGTLASWVAALPDTVGPKPARVVLLSPNYGPRDPLAKLLLAPWAPVLVPRIRPAFAFGDTNTWRPIEKRIATVRIPIEATFAMQGLVDRVLHMPFRHWTTPVLAIWNHDDPVVDPAAIAKFTGALASKGVRVVRDSIVPAPGEHAHIIAGAVHAPSQTARVGARIVAFVRQP